MSNNTVTGPKGFEAAGVACGIKTTGNKDLGLIVCSGGAVAAGVFTTNKVVSAAVTVCREHLSSDIVSAVVVNAGCANTCTGSEGIENAEKMCEMVAQGLGVDAGKVLVASTGIIGHQLPMDKISNGITAALNTYHGDEDRGQDFAQAIMTTDTVAKQAAARVEIGGAEVTVAGTIKGAGMIGPNMATTLCFITTDAAITRPLLAKALKAAIGNSVNKLTVDGHQSTNDTALLLASGQAGNPTIAKSGKEYDKFAGAVMEVCVSLAKQMALDAEGATRMFTVVITGASSKVEAAKAARAVADYPLFKCAVHGSDPNWGRIICAVGSCGVRLNPEKLSCKIGDITVFKNGQPAKFNPKKASDVISQKEHTVTVELGVGKYSDFCYGCDLSKEYVTINADYHT
jgi:glutamate N-acetyltransferase / amino-acid N-acetyltransferase